MEPLFRTLVVGVVPQPTQAPPLPFDREDLERIFMEVSRTYPYSQFGLLPAEQGAQLLNPPDDRILIQPVLLQVNTPIQSTAALIREKAVAVFRVITDRLKISRFIQLGIKVVAHVPAPPGGAKEFIADRLLGQGERSKELGPDFFVGGVKFRRIDPEAQQEHILLIEPLIADDDFIWIDYDVQRAGPFEGLDSVGPAVDDAFTFVREETMTILKEA